MISLVIPCYNETEVLRLTYETLNEEAQSWNEAVEIILVDDGSSDDTWAIIESLARRDPRVRGVRLSRNFGHQAAMGAGLEVAVGDAVVVLDADLQDPPALVREMLAKWRAGFEVVYAQRKRRAGETFFKRFTAKLYYRLLDYCTQVSIPRDTGDFALLDAKVVRALLELREHALFWRGLRKWTGFRQTAVMFDRPERLYGQTKYTLKKMIGLAWDGLLSFSRLPLRLAFYAGGATLLATLGFTAVDVGHSMVGAADGLAVPVASLAMFYLGSVQLICLGIVGEYLNRVYDEVRARPRWIISQTIGVVAERKLAAAA